MIGGESLANGKTARGARASRPEKQKTGIGKQGKPWRKGRAKKKRK
jgi:hypothetical protein